MIPRLGFLKKTKYILEITNEAIKALYLNNIQIFWLYKDFVCVKGHVVHVTYTLKAFASRCRPVLLPNFSQRQLTSRYMINVQAIVPFTDLQLPAGDTHFAVYFKHKQLSK